jgi:hypothetical protein
MQHYKYLKNADFWDMAPCRFCVTRLSGGMLVPRSGDFSNENIYNK